jgi:glycosyltransferase involved in cell wall biosynthesis
MAQLHRRSETRTHVDVEVIVPALNEEARIGPVLRDLTSFLESQPHSARITVVDNGSVDRTAQVVDAGSRTTVPVRLIGCAARGKGAAVRRGFAAADSRFVGFCDADLSTPIDTLARILPLLEQGHDFVIASRRAPGAEYVTAQPLQRRVGSYAFRRLSASVAGGVQDTQCGFKFLRTSLAKQLAAEAMLNGFAFDIELIGLALAGGTEVVEVPVRWTDDPASTFDALSHGLQAFGDMRRVRRRLGARPTVAAAGGRPLQRSR